jgi:hypothetical protein
MNDPKRRTLSAYLNKLNGQSLLDKLLQAAKGQAVTDEIEVGGKRYRVTIRQNHDWSGRTSLATRSQ